MGAVTNEAIAARLREIRGNEPQFFFAQRFGISQSRWSRLELGIAKLTAVEAARIASKLGMSLDELLGATPIIDARADLIRVREALAAVYEIAAAQMR